ncbi:hypothetical protein VNO80_06908 [Phaseolus coccineus]|uniref:Uncharacterized protein n=1 Tax=Phaseolus coccineus TaxID=3886 RepID=A0AAN9NML7_PHACN
MKMCTTTLFPLFLLCVFTSYLPSTSADGMVVDTKGENVTYWGQYYIIPLERDPFSGGGADITTTGNETCPLTVIQSYNGFSDGQPLRFSSDYRRSPFLLEGDYFDIRLPGYLSCTTVFPLKWTVLAEDVESGVLYVKIKGYDNTIDGFFKTKSDPDHKGGYNLFFCDYDDECSYLTVKVDDDKSRLLVFTKSDKNRLVIQFKNSKRELKATA